MAGDPTDDDLLAEAVDWRMRIDAAPHDTTLRAALAAWLAASEARRSAYEDVAHMTRVASTLPTDYADPHGRLMGRPGSPPRSAQRASRVRRASFAAIALAACIAFLFLPALQSWLASDYRTGTAELRTVTLDDGTAVSLDAESAIAVRYVASRREVTLLAGQAYFDVVPAADRPFVVVAHDATVTVMGTAFDVKLLADTTTVAVQSGTVEVALDQERGPVATLTRGERLEINKASGRVAKSDIRVADVAAWRERRLILDRATVADMAEEVGRHYGGIVMLRDRAFGARLVSGVFDLNHPIEALQAAVRTYDGDITRITPYVVVITGP